MTLSSIQAESQQAVLEDEDSSDKVKVRKQRYKVEGVEFA